MEKLLKTRMYKFDSKKVFYFVGQQKNKILPNHLCHLIYSATFNPPDLTLIELKLESVKT
jgi:hypothetical protein